ncbi:hypothetical protein GCM10022280_08850 [Sphingomonas swuensis]|uniref:Uncharacterized protein n=1 Tax=Sphingomonas swuensis TaxID=977800 RepID=A0ABP7SL33_9SPHN
MISHRPTLRALALSAAILQAASIGALSIALAVPAALLPAPAGGSTSTHR